MRQYLLENLTWKQYSIDEYEGIIATEFLGQEYTKHYTSEFGGEYVVDLVKQDLVTQILSTIVDVLQKEPVTLNRLRPKFPHTMEKIKVMVGIETPWVADK